MATKEELYNHLQRLQEENHFLKRENELFRSALMSIYVKTRSSLGIEAAIQAREEERHRVSIK